MDDSAPLEVELALAVDGAYRARAVFGPAARVSLGRSAKATLQVGLESLPELHVLLQVEQQGLRLFLADGMDVQLSVGEERSDLEALRAAGELEAQEGVSTLLVPSGGNAIISLGRVRVMMKCRASWAPEQHVGSQGGEVQVCGVCGSDLQLWLDHPMALSPCPRCQTRNRVFGSSSFPAPGSMGPQGSSADFVPVAAKSDAAVVTAQPLEQPKSEPVEVAPERVAPVATGSGQQAAVAPQDFEDEATQPSLSERGGELQREEDKRAQLSQPVNKDASLPVAARHEDGSERGAGAEHATAKPLGRKRRPVGSLWTPRARLLLALGLSFGALGLLLICYALLAG